MSLIRVAQQKQRWVWSELYNKNKDESDCTGIGLYAQW